MSSCERCWSDASVQAAMCGDNVSEVYRRLIGERNCSPEEHAGRDAEKCEACGRMTRHQFTGLCQVPGCKLGEYK